MSAHHMAGGVPLGTQTIQIDEIVTYPVALVAMREGGEGISDASHFLSIAIPSKRREIRIPYNPAALRRLGRDAMKAGGFAMPVQDQQEGSE